MSVNNDKALVYNPRKPRLLTVKKAWYLTPNMIRVVFSGPELEGIPEGCEGGNCKLFFPEPQETAEKFSERLLQVPRPTTRTYTVRDFDAPALELTIDFVAHGDSGPASRWAANVRAGGFLGFAGPSAPKVSSYEADWYLVAADASALPLASVVLEALPSDAKGVAVFEVPSDDDRQEIDAPDGIEIHWLIHPDPYQASDAQVKLIRSLDWPNGRVQTCIAGESGVIKSLRTFLTKEKQLPRSDVYISGYWKIGLIEDEHQKEKRA